jgi:hypothetical protein
MVKYWLEIQQWKMVSGGAVKERKERKGWESGEKRKETAGMGEEDSSLHLGPESEHGKRCCCPPFFRL